MTPNSEVVEPMMLAVEPLAPFGAVVRGVDVRPLQAAQAAWLKSYLYQHGVLVLRGQASPSDADFSAFMAGLGTIAEPKHQGAGLDNSLSDQATRAGRADVVLLNNDPTPEGPMIGYGVRPRGLGWHSDYSWAEAVSSIAALEAQIVTSWGGETLFANMYSVYDSLEPDIRQLVGRLSALHSLPVAIDHREPGEEILARSCERPLVIRNPYTGRRGLYLSSLYTTRILGLPDDEAAALYDYLIELSTSSRFVYEHTWQQGDIALWDEIGMIHSRRPFDESETRLMRQIAVVVDDPDAPFTGN